MSIDVKQTSVLALIPARGGSKGVPRKNLRLLAGRPLIVHAIKVAQQTAQIDRVLVSTDDSEIAQVAQQHGAEVPFQRPARLAADDTTDLAVFQHALTWLDAHEGCHPDVIVHLRPTSPFRTSNDIDQALQLLADHPEADSVRSVSRPSQNPYKMWRIDQGVLVPLLDNETKEAYNQPRQTLPTTYWQNGCVDVIRLDTILAKQSMTGQVIVPMIMNQPLQCDLDRAIDFDIAEAMFRMFVHQSDQQ